MDPQVGSFLGTLITNVRATWRPNSRAPGARSREQSHVGKQRDERGARACSGDRPAGLIAGHECPFVAGPFVDKRKAPPVNVEDTTMATRKSALTTPAISNTTPAATSEAAPPAARSIRLRLACGVLAGPLYLVVSYAQAFTRDGFDLTRDAFSYLSLGDLGSI
jgi:hypothetical protein